MHLTSTVRLGSLRDCVSYLLSPGENERVRLLEVGGIVSPGLCKLDEPTERAAAVRLMVTQLRLFAASCSVWGGRIAGGGNPAVAHRVIISPPPQAEYLEDADYLWLAQSAAAVHRWGRADEGCDRTAWLVVLHEKPGQHGRPGHAHMLDLLLDGRGRVRDVRRDWIHNEAATTVAAMQLGLPVVPGRHPRGVLALLDAYDPDAVPAYEDALRAALRRTEAASTSGGAGREALLAAYARHVVPTFQRRNPHPPRSTPRAPGIAPATAPAVTAATAPAPVPPSSVATVSAHASIVGVSSGNVFDTGPSDASAVAPVAACLSLLRSAAAAVVDAAQAHALAVGGLRRVVEARAVERVPGVGVWSGPRGIHAAAVFAAPRHAHWIAGDPRAAASHAQLEATVEGLAAAAKDLRTSAARQCGAYPDALMELARLRAELWERLAWVPPGAVGEELPAARCADVLDPRGVPVAASLVRAALAAAPGAGGTELDAAPWELLLRAGVERSKLDAREPGRDRAPTIMGRVKDGR
jgi:hypothetical protein